MQIVSGDVLLNTTSGNVGIGTTTPTEKLDVSGKTKTINLQVTSGATAGYVLTSDSSGNGTWQTPTVTADTYTTGFTYQDNTFTISDSSGNTLNATINSVTGLTVNGNLTVTGNTSLQSISGTSLDISGNSSSDLVTITQTGSGNAFVVEDSSRPDSTPFIINSNGSTSIGSSTYLTSVGGIPATLQISNGSAGAITLPIISTPLAIQSNSSTTVSIFSPNAGLSQLTFGSPSDSYASIFRYTPNITQLLLSTTTSGGVIDFQSGTGTFAMRINNNQNIGIGTTSPQARLDVRAQGALSTDIAFRVRNSADTANQFAINGTSVISHLNGTAPSTNITDSYQQYSADITAGNAAPHFRTENGAIVKVYQETTGVAASTLVTGVGTPLTDTDTFDGYTLKQIVKALRNQGLLA
jgi:hypothetical protein